MSKQPLAGCVRCGQARANDVYGSYCEDCWSERQPQVSRWVVRRIRRGQTGVDSEQQYEHGLRGWRWLDVWGKASDD